MRWHCGNDHSNSLAADDYRQTQLLCQLAQQSVDAACHICPLAHFCHWFRAARGLELLALGSALYYVNWKLQYRHVITLSDDSVCIDKGFYLPRQSWKFPRQGTGLAIIPEQHPWDGPELSLQRTGESVSVGEFLNRDDSLKLADLLRQEIRVGSHSEPGKRLF